MRPAPDNKNSSPDEPTARQLRQRAIIVAQSKGGVGKTVVATIIAELLSLVRGEEHVRLLDCDSRHKLSLMFPDRTIKFEPGATLDEMRTDGRRAVAYWDKLGAQLFKGDHRTAVIADLGANVDRSVWEWATSSAIPRYFEKKGIKLDVVVPTTADPLAIEGAVSALGIVGDLFPSARRVLVLNESAGGFDPYRDHGPFRQIMDMPEVTKISIGKCASELWAHFERDGISPTRALGMSEDMVVERYLLTDTPWVAERALGDIGAWAGAAMASFRNLYDEARPTVVDGNDV